MMVIHEAEGFGWSESAEAWWAKEQARLDALAPRIDLDGRDVKPIEWAMQCAREYGEPYAVVRLPSGAWLATPADGFVLRDGWQLFAIGTGDDNRVPTYGVPVIWPGAYE